MKVKLKAIKGFKGSPGKPANEMQTFSLLGLYQFSSFTDEVLESIPYTVFRMYSSLQCIPFIVNNALVIGLKETPNNSGIS